MHFMYLAYKYVAVAVMLAEANFNAETLDLPIERPIVSSMRSSTYIAPISTLADDGFGGNIDAEGYAFGEDGRPALGLTGFRDITKLDPFNGLSVAEQNETLGGQRSLVGTNGAYQLASNWLALIEVDVPALEKTNKVEVEQRGFWGDGSPAPLVLTPIFTVHWGAKVEVEVDGRTRQMLRITQHDDCFSRRPVELVKDLDKLLAIPDEEFLKYSAAERSNLVSRFSATTYVPVTNHTGAIPKPPQTRKP